MSSSLAPSWAFAAEAIDGIGDTHLPKGVHVRALPSPRLGLPVAPLAVYRAVVPPDQLKRLSVSGGVRWFDSTGAEQTLPFTVSADNPVYGYFPQPDVIFAELSATPARQGVRPLPGVANLADLLATPAPAVAPLPRPPIAVARPAATTTRTSLLADPRALASFIDRASAALDLALGRPAPLRFEALANTPLGPGAFQSRSAGPYALAAWTIPLVRVVGSGTVQGIRWLDAGRLKGVQQDRFWELWSLPVDPAPRYAPTPAARAEAKDRIARAAVTRQPLSVAFGATAPSAAPAATPADALQRVDQVRPELDRWLKRLLTDLSQPIDELQDVHPITGQNGKAAIPIEPFLIGGAVDPDVAHYLGFGDCDQEPPAPAGALVLYRVRGLWRWDPKRFLPPERGGFAPAIRASLDVALKDFPEFEKSGVKPIEKGPLADLHAMAVALIGTPPDPPLPISFDAAQDRGWLATPPPPNVRRALRLQAHGFRPHAVAALAATDSNGDRSLHPYPKLGRIPFMGAAPHDLPLPLVVSRPQDAEQPGEGRFEDRDAPEGPVLYRLAAGDWFGRWGGWRTRTAPAKPRTPPMRPTLEAFVHPPAVPVPVPDTTLAGVVDLRVPVPRAADLPAGGAALARLDLDETFEGGPTSHASIPLAGAAITTDPVTGHDVLTLSRPGPALARATQRKATYKARWVDTLGHVSPDSDPAIRTIVDPRPPPPPPVITELRYTARPDSQGHARVDLDFASTPGTRYRVFASTEPTLLKYLDGTGHGAAAGAIRAAEPGAPRAMQFRAFQSLFDWDAWECVTEQPILASAPTTHFIHRVSGSLDVLAIYRVLGEGPSGALSEMTTADIVPFAVPNLGGPATPLLSLLNAGLDPTTQGVRLAVRVPVGKAVPAAWRLRRASAPVRDPLGMDIVATGPVAGASVDAQATSFEIAATAPLKPWRQYRFAVQVQSAPPPGAPTIGVIPAGEWSETSSVAALAVIPPAAPLPPSAVSIANTATDLAITLTHPAPDSLVGTAMGPFRFELWRCEPGARPVQLGLAFSRGAGATWVATAPGLSAPGAYVTVAIIDPVGRRSDARPSNQL